MGYGTTRNSFFKEIDEESERRIKHLCSTCTTPVDEKEKKLLHRLAIWEDTNNLRYFISSYKDDRKITLYNAAISRKEELDKQIHDIDKEIVELERQLDVFEDKEYLSSSIKENKERKRRLQEINNKVSQFVKQESCPHDVVALYKDGYACVECYKKGRISAETQRKTLMNTDKIIIPVDCEIFDERTNQIIDELHSWYTKLKEKGYTIEQIRDEANNLNCDDYINKPYQKKKK